MPFTLGDTVFYNWLVVDFQQSFGPVAVALVTSVNPDDGTASLTVFPTNASYLVTRSGIAEGTEPGQASSTPPAVLASSVPPPAAHASSASKPKQA